MAASVYSDPLDGKSDINQYEDILQQFACGNIDTLATFKKTFDVLHTIFPKAFLSDDTGKFAISNKKVKRYQLEYHPDKLGRESVECNALNVLKEMAELHKCAASKNKWFCTYSIFFGKEVNHEKDYRSELIRRVNESIKDLSTEEIDLFFRPYLLHSINTCIKYAHGQLLVNLIQRKTELEKLGNRKQNFQTSVQTGEESVVQHVKKQKKE